MKRIFGTLAAGALGIAVASRAQTPPQGQELVFPSAAEGPSIEEVSQGTASLLTLGLARIEARLDRLSDRHQADFAVRYDAEHTLIRISISSRELEATEDNCRHLIEIVKKDAEYFVWDDEAMPTRYAYFFVNAGEDAADIDKHIDISATIDRSVSTASVNVSDEITCTGDFSPQD